MNVLVVKYCPRADRSRTGRLVDYAVKVLTEQRAQLEVLDIAKDIPDLFTPERLAVYYERNYDGQKISTDKAAQMSRMDRMTAQIKRADALVLGYPMHNFSQPAVVKAWFDSVMLKGETWDITAAGFTGLLKGRKALVVTTSGGAYQGPMAGWEHSSSLSSADLNFMGFEVDTVAAEGLNMYPEKEAQILEAAKTKLLSVLKSWS